MKIFGPADLRALVTTAKQLGLELVGELTDDVLAHPARPVHWTRTGLDYTFVLLTFVRH